MTDSAEAEIRAIVQAGLDTISDAATAAKDALIVTGDKRIAAVTPTSPEREVIELVKAFYGTVRMGKWDAKIGIEGVLTHLDCTGRLVPAGGMPLTAQEFADFLNMIHEGRGDYSSRDRLRERFAATEFNDVQCGSGSVDGEVRCTLPAGHHEFHDYMSPAPAVPAEEETKAEDESGWHWVQSAGGYYSGPACTGGYECKSMAHHEGCLRPTSPASSPVVPAPTETGPWKTLDVIPVDVRKVRDGLGELWKRDDLGRWLAYTSDERAYVMVALPVSSFDEFAPFVAVEARDA